MHMTFTSKAIAALRKKFEAEYFAVTGTLPVTGDCYLNTMSALFLRRHGHHFAISNNTWFIFFTKDDSRSSYSS